MLKLGLMDNGPDNPYSAIGINDPVRPWTKPEAAALARKATIESIVLMKNDGLLPLRKERIKSIAVIGPRADAVISDWYAGTPPYTVSILAAIRNALGRKSTCVLPPTTRPMRQLWRRAAPMPPLYVWEIIR